MIFVDINNDGLLDIYLCYFGDKVLDLCCNEFYINQGNNGEGVFIFKEEVVKYGFDLFIYFIQVFFFDYDWDGDFDCYFFNYFIEDF